MKKSTLVLIAVTLSLTAGAQITIDQGDMPAAGDTVRVSNGLITPAIDPVPAGPNALWDFSTLQHISQTIDTFLTIAQTNGTYQLIFANVGFNPNRANLAAKGNFNLPAVPGLAVEDIYGFFYSTAASYKMVGIGATLNGLATPAPFGNKDVIYNFPLDFNDADSSDSDLALNVPGLGYYGFNQHRVNTCDGWGTLITPFGTFPVLRVKSTLYVHDTVYVSTLGLGFGQDRPVAREYKWLGKNMSIPLLEILTSELAGQENITSVRYRDSVRAPLGIVEHSLAGNIGIYPVPAHDEVYVQFSLKASAQVVVSLYDATGKRQVLTDRRFPAGEVTERVSLAGLRLPPGMYLVEVNVAGIPSLFKLPVE